MRQKPTSQVRGLKVRLCVFEQRMLRRRRGCSDRPTPHCACTGWICLLCAQNWAKKWRNSTRRRGSTSPPSTEEKTVWNVSDS